MALFETQVTLNCAIDKAFDFLVRPANLVQFSPPEWGLHFIAAPEVIELGSRLQFKVQNWGQVMNIEHEVIEFERPARFSERQVRGPFKRWVHDHLMETDAAGQVVVIDRIAFDPPGGLIGLLVTEKKILEHLEDGFYERHIRLRRLLETG